MLFNGKYYNKPGHLGMTTDEVKAALAGAAKLPEVDGTDEGKVLTVDAEGNIAANTINNGYKYEHRITVAKSPNYGPTSYLCAIYNNDATPLTKADLTTILNNAGYTGTNKGKYYPVNGIYIEKSSDDVKFYFIYGLTIQLSDVQVLHNLLDYKISTSTWTYTEGLYSGTGVNFPSLLTDYVSAIY